MRKAAATVDEKNAFTAVKGVFNSSPDTRIGLIILAVTHTSNHYGQVVEYLRMNGLTPPQSIICFSSQRVCHDWKRAISELAGHLP